MDPGAPRGPCSAATRPRGRRSAARWTRRGSRSAAAPPAPRAACAGRGRARRRRSTPRAARARESSAQVGCSARLSSPEPHPRIGFYAAFGDSLRRLRQLVHGRRQHERRRHDRESIVRRRRHTDRGDRDVRGRRHRARSSQGGKPVRAHPGVRVVVGHPEPPARGTFAAGAPFCRSGRPSSSRRASALRRQNTGSPAATQRQPDRLGVRSACTTTTSTARDPGVFQDPRGTGSYVSLRARDRSAARFCSGISTTPIVHHPTTCSTPQPRPWIVTCGARSRHRRRGCGRADDRLLERGGDEAPASRRRVLTQARDRAPRRTRGKPRLVHAPSHSRYERARVGE